MCLLVTPFAVGDTFGGETTQRAATPQKQAAAPEKRAAASEKPVSVQTFPGTDTDGDPSRNSVCPIDVDGKRGYRICEFQYFRYEWKNGSLEYFVVGTGYSVWHAWTGSGGWKGLGGSVRYETPNGTWDTDPAGVATVSPGHNCWWRPRGNGEWPGSWRLC